MFLRGLPEEKEKSVKGQLYGDKWKLNFGGEHAAVFTEVETCGTHEFMNVINQCHLNKKHI